MDQLFCELITDAIDTKTSSSRLLLETEWERQLEMGIWRQLNICQKTIQGWSAPINKEDIIEFLQQLIIHPELLNLYAENVQQLGKQNHNSKDIITTFYGTLK